MMKKLQILSILAVFMLLAAGCGASREPVPSAADSAPTQAEAETGSQVASADQMAGVEDVVEAGMVPVYGSSLNDGVYSVTVDSSSSMFRITECQLTVAGGKMTAEMHMGGKGYLKVFMGTGEEAAAASGEACIPYTEAADGSHIFTVPVEALDMGIPCAAFSKNKELWYDRTLVFRADSLPAEAFAEGTYLTADSLEDGSYTVEVRLEGGSGKASVESPAALRVENGAALATIVWSSSNYDYMRIGDEKFLPVNPEGNSTFEIPISVFDRNMTVFADTTAMSTPHEIEYALYFDSATLKEAP